MALDLALQHGGNSFEAELWADGPIRVRVTSAYPYAGNSVHFTHYGPEGYQSFLSALDVRRKDFRLVFISEAMRAFLRDCGYDLGGRANPVVQAA